MMDIDDREIQVKVTMTWKFRTPLRHSLDLFEEQIERALPRLVMHQLWVTKESGLEVVAETRSTGERRRS